jgi:hypothetical protein
MRIELERGLSGQKEPGVDHHDWICIQPWESNRPGTVNKTYIT